MSNTHQTRQTPNKNDRAGWPQLLTVAGSDSSGGAGIQADLKTCSALQVYAASVITAVTAQNTRGVTAVHPVPPEIVRAQLSAVLEDLDIRAIKIGMLANREIIETVAAVLCEMPRRVPIILDPVMVATSGARLLEPDAICALTATLMAQASVVTPNLHEAACMLGEAVAKDHAARRRQCEEIAAMGARAVLLKGGHGSGSQALDLLFDGSRFETYSAQRIATSNTHGTGCTLASAIACGLAYGMDLSEAVARAKQFVTLAIGHGRTQRIGTGPGPLDHISAGREMAPLTAARRD